uniref:Ribonuclease Z n=1 Tax=Ophidocladus simpliciusculus TaxID=1261574 RepID=A0A1Z1MIY9_9FLOR|nr:ribonuclease Z [Ophidocladus simpliciusculus]ARW65916.1 ribonuclease Z [Ophidocladus simpliciusculus]
MIFRLLDINASIFKKTDSSFLMKLSAFKDIWIFNCIEGSQSNIVSCGFKINNLSKIIIMNLHIKNISGLLGLLSSLNLIGRTKCLHIYAHMNLKYYLDLGKKYSWTNFNYRVYIHVLKTGLIINQCGYRVYVFCRYKKYEFIIMQPEQYGTFFLNKARNNCLFPGPLYGKLKKGSTFILPDGLILNGYNLTGINLSGLQILLFISFFYTRKNFEAFWHSDFILFTL